jgi:hypothetical protein
MKQTRRRGRGQKFSTKIFGAADGGLLLFC